MRWLLILCVTLASLVMVLPVPASAGAADVGASGAAMMADCHGMAADNAPVDEGSTPDTPSFAIHACSGCAFFPASGVLIARTARPTVPGPVTRLPEKPSSLDTPVPPPPRWT